jgi:hypothetical protein
MSKRAPRDGRTAPKRIERLSRSPNPCAKETARVLTRFAGLPRAEGAFYLEFQRLRPSDANVLAHHWGSRDPWHVFRRLCRFFCL